MTRNGHECSSDRHRSGLLFFLLLLYGIGVITMFIDGKLRQLIDLTVGVH